MNFFLGFVSTNEKACDVFRDKQAKLIPDEIKKKCNGTSFHFGAFNPSNSNQNFASFISDKTKKSDAALIITHSACLKEVKPFKNALFLCIAEPLELQNYQNFFSQNLTLALKNYLKLSEVMRNSAEEQMLILPLRNFLAPELDILQNEFTNKSLSGEFGDWLNSQLTKLKLRKQPRRSSNSKKSYFIDDNKYYYEYGHEIHGSFDTGHPHTKACEFNGNFRFGKRLENIDRHFNVFGENKGNTTISGKFTNCHDISVSVNKVTHINMFSNDYHR